MWRGEHKLSQLGPHAEGVDKGAEWLEQHTTIKDGERGGEELVAPTTTEARGHGGVKLEPPTATEAMGRGEHELVQLDPHA